MLLFVVSNEKALDLSVGTVTETVEDSELVERSGREVAQHEHLSKVSAFITRQVVHFHFFPPPALNISLNDGSFACPLSASNLSLSFVFSTTFSLSPITVLTIVTSAFDVSLIGVLHVAQHIYIVLRNK